MEIPSLKDHNNIEMGIKSLCISPSKAPIVDVLGDYIGMESCYDMKKNLEVCNHNPSMDDVYCQIRDRRDQRQLLKKKEFPPLISLLAHTENMASHMPWVLKREYTSDGRLILTEERVKHHEYLQAHRSDGRLTMQLVHLDEDEEEEDDDDEDINNDNANEEGQMENKGDSVEEENAHEDEDGGGEEGEVDGSSSSSSSSSNGNGSGAVKYMKYNSGRGGGSSCLLRMAVPAIRPVHT